MTTPKKNNYHNTWHHARELRANLQTGFNPYLDGLEGTWKAIASHQGDITALRTDDEKIADNPLSAFSFYLQAGYYPPPEILLAIDSAFIQYKSNAGELELEDVFFGHRKKGVGNYAARESGQSFYRLLYLIDRHDDTKGLTQITEELFLEFSIDRDIDSFLRGYRRWKGHRDTGSADT